MIPETAKQNSFDCIREALPNTRTPQEFALDGGVIYYFLANSDESHADEVFISVL